MPLIFYDGGAFSGRSDALRRFAWGAAGESDGSGQYLHPDLPANLSGLAGGVAGERRLHARVAGLEFAADCADLVAPAQDQTLHSLSGGERAALVLGCALTLTPTRLALDGVMEQLDRSARSRTFELLRARAPSMDIRFADNDAAGFVERVDEVRRFEASASLSDFTTRFSAIADYVAGRRARAPTISLRRVCFRYGRSRADVFKDADFVLEPGRPYLLKARNGAGKSTLARLVAGVLAPTKGDVLLDGRRAEAGLANGGACFYCFQNPRDQVFGGAPRRYLETVATAARARGREPVPGGAAEALERFGLSRFASEDLFDLPFVALKRLGAAAAFVSGAPWLFFDEPALGLDQKGREGLRAFVTALCQAGHGVIVVTHGDEFDSTPLARPLTIADGRLV